MDETGNKNYNLFQIYSGILILKFVLQLSELPTTKLIEDVSPMMNTAVIELMLQLPGLDKDMIVNVSNIFNL